MDPKERVGHGARGDLEGLQGEMADNQGQDHGDQERFGVFSHGVKGAPIRTGASFDLGSGLLGDLQGGSLPALRLRRG